MTFKNFRYLHTQYLARISKQTVIISLKL